MAYKSKNLNITRNRASAANTSALTDLNNALSGMNEFKTGMQDLLKIQKRTAKDKQSIQKLVTLQQFKNFSEDMSMKEYEQYKTNFMGMVEKDKIIGTIFYSDTTEKIDIEWLEPTWSSDIEQLMMGDIMFMDGLKQVFVSRYEDRKNWMLNLHKYDFKTVFYAGEARIVNET